MPTVLIGLHAGKVAGSVGAVECNDWFGLIQNYTNFLCAVDRSVLALSSLTFRSPVLADKGALIER